MRIDRQLFRVCRAAALVSIALSVLVAGADLRSVEHPTLVKVDSAGCAVCHEDLIADRSTVHPPAADDCTTCHDVTVESAGTTVEAAGPDPDLCVACHDDRTNAVNGDLAVPHPPVMDACTTCHDPHASSRAALLNVTQVELCSTCHDLDDLAAKHGEQITAATKCSSCHDVHGSDHPKMLLAGNTHRPFADGSCAGCHLKPFGERVRFRARGEKLCESCHGVFEVPAGGSRHQAMDGQKGRAGCLECHAPHMSPNEALLLRSGTDVCGACHAEVVAGARAETGHAAAAEDCTTCHAPHSSASAHLLNAPADELCRTCHDVDEDGLRASHLGRDLSAASCVSCHDPHGVGNAHLLARNVHAAIADGCDTCHEGPSVVDDGSSSLCLMCHEDIGEAAERAVEPHAAMELARCADCHNPHASAQSKLVREPGGAICVACHEDKAPGEGEVAHEVVEIAGCQACHEPHGGSRGFFLRAEADDLCLSCHDPRRIAIDPAATTVVVLGGVELPIGSVKRAATLRLSADGERGHPVADHRVIGAIAESEVKQRHTEVAFDGERLGCLSCHDPHKGRSNRLLKWGASSSMEACIQCHPK